MGSLKLKLVDALRWPVTIYVPQDGGTTTSVEVVGVFRPVLQTEFNELVGGKHRDSEILEKVLVGWDGIADADGNPLAFSPESLKTLTEIGYARVGFMSAFMEVQGAGLAKN